MNTTKATTSTAMTMKTTINTGDSAPVRPNSSRLAKACGKLATIPAKMIRLVPLPTPRDVICSPIHIRNMVPPTSVTTQESRKNRPGSTTAEPNCPRIPSSPMAMPYDCTSAISTVRYRVYWFIFLRPLSPSFLSASSDGTAADISCTMMLAEMYGMILSANTVIRPSAPPLNMSNMPRMPLPCCASNSPMTEASTPGTGM